MRYHENESDNNLYSTSNYFKNVFSRYFFQECLFLILQIHLTDCWQQKVTFRQNIANRCQQFLNVYFLKRIFLALL